MHASSHHQGWILSLNSELLGYEFAKSLGIRTPQARVIHNVSSEWLQIKEAAEKAKHVALIQGNELAEMTCSELIEALELSRCLLLTNYVHGSPLLESSTSFESLEAAGKTAASLGRILMLDLVIRNEDRLRCHHLRWRGNFANLLLAGKVDSASNDALEVAFDSAIKRYRPKVIRALQKEIRATSVDSVFDLSHPGLVSQGSDVPNTTESIMSLALNESTSSNFLIVVANYPKFIELLLNSSEYASQLLHEITGGKIESSQLVTDANDFREIEINSAVHEFSSGFRAALRDLQGFHMFLLTLYQKLNSLLRAFLNTVDKSSGDLDKEDPAIPESPAQARGAEVHCPSSPSRDGILGDDNLDLNDSDTQRTALRLPSSGYKESSDTCSPISRDIFLWEIKQGKR